jgi:hypothetical protein
VPNGADHRPVFVMRLRPEPHVADAAYNLRALLKIALRHFSLKCTACTEVKREEDT